MLEISESHFLSHPDQLILEMRRRWCSGRIVFCDGTFIELEWGAVEAANESIYQTQGGVSGGKLNNR